MDKVYKNEAPVPKRWWPIYVIVLASFLGILDAGYLTYEHYAGKNVKCLIAQGCEVVTTSRYSQIAGLPLSAFGLVFYLSVFIVGLVITDKKNTAWHPFILYTSAAAFAISALLVYVQLFVLQAVCPYCMASAGISTLIFFCAGLFQKSAQTLSDGGSGEMLY